MDISDYLSSLSYGVLSNTAAGSEGTGSISPSRLHAVVQHINEGLLALHGRFVLKQDIIVIQMKGGKTIYEISSAESFATVKGYDPDPNTTAWDDPFILDTVAKPYQDDMIKILSVFDAHGRKVPLNDLHHWVSLFTPKPHTLQVVHPELHSLLSVEYQAKCLPIEIVSTGEEDPEYEATGSVDLPDVLIEALSEYVAYKIFTNMNTQESTAKAQEHFQMYEKHCMDMLQYDLVNSSNHFTNSRFRINGWV